MKKGDTITLLDGQKARVIRGAESGPVDIFIVILTTGFLRLIDDKRDTLLYSLGEVSL
jgi:hypothetical protein